MEKIIIAGHGSPKKDANNIEQVAGLLHNMIHPACNDDCVRVAYLQFAEPDIAQAITSCVDDGAKKVIVHPYFLSSGMHVTSDIPEIIDEARKNIRMLNLSLPNRSGSTIKWPRWSWRGLIPQPV